MKKTIGIIGALDEEIEEIKSRLDITDKKSIADRYQDFKYEQYDFGQLLNIPSSKKYDASSDELFYKANELLKDKASKLELLRFYFYSYIIQFLTE